MSQDRNVEYNVPLTSFQVNQLNQGLLPKGRYQGFDTIDNPGGVGLNIRLLNNLGFTRVDIANAFETTNRAIMVTPLGSVIHTDENPTLPIDDTAGGQRRDLVVLNHEFTQVAGGSLATFSIVTGTPLPIGDPSYSVAPLPTLPNPQKQTIIGILEHKNSNVSTRIFADIKFIPAKTPDYNSNNIARLDSDNYFTSGFEGDTTADIVPGDINTSVLTLPSKSKEYKLNIIAPTTVAYITNHVINDESADNFIPVNTIVKLRVQPLGTAVLILDTNATLVAGQTPIRPGFGNNNLNFTTSGTVEIRGSVTLKLSATGYWEVIDMQVNPQTDSVLGVWNSYTVLDADLSSPSGTWTVSGTLSTIVWTKVGKTVTAQINLINNNLNAVAAAHIDLTIPAEIGNIVTTKEFSSSGFFNNSIEPQFGVGTALAIGRGTLRIYNVGTSVLRMTADTWNNIHTDGGSNNMLLQGQIVFEIQ